MKRLSSRKKSSFGSILSVSPGGSAGNEGHDCNGSTGSEPSVGMLTDPGSVSLFDGAESPIAAVTSTSRALSARGRRGVGVLSAYTHSRWTLSQFLQLGWLSSHLTLRLRHVKLSTC